MTTAILFITVLVIAIVLIVAQKEPEALDKRMAKLQPTPMPKIAPSLISSHIAEREKPALSLPVKPGEIPQGVITVPSMSEMGMHYEVDLKELICTCPDWKWRKEYPQSNPMRLCKHIIQEMGKTIGFHMFPYSEELLKEKYQYRKGYSHSAQIIADDIYGDGDYSYRLTKIQKEILGEMLRGDLITEDSNNVYWLSKRKIQYNSMMALIHNHLVCSSDPEKDLNTYRNSFKISQYAIHLLKQSIR